MQGSAAATRNPAESRASLRVARRAAHPFCCPPWSFPWARPPCHWQRPLRRPWWPQRPPWCRAWQQQTLWEAAGALGGPGRRRRRCRRPHEQVCVRPLPCADDPPCAGMGSCNSPPPDLVCSGQKDTPAPPGALPIGWPAAAAVPPPDGPVATLHDRRVRLGPAGAPDEQQPSLYRLCRQWVQNDPDLPAELVEVSLGAGRW